MVVVVMISIIAAVAIPALISRMRTEREGGEVAEHPEDGDVEEVRAAEEEVEPPPPGVVPTLVAGDVAVEVTTTYELRGVAVRTVVEADVKAEYELRNDHEEEKILLDFPFSPSVFEVSGASVEVETESARFVEPEGVSYSGRRMRWAGSLAPGSTLKVRATYLTRSLDRFSLELPGEGRKGKIDVVIAAGEARADWVPPESLRPTRVEPDLLAWDLANVITDRPILLEPPASVSPVGRLLLLFRLVGLAVTIFGAGFWYLSEFHQPGKLDSFRWGHFLLLATTFSLFFVVFAVLAFGSPEHLWLNLAAAAVVSLPLLVLHVSRFMSLRFALAFVLPLALYSLGIVVCGVYAESWRSYCFVAAGAFGVATLTITYPVWSEGRRAHRREEQQRRGRARRIDGVVHALDEEKKAVQEAQRTALAAAVQLERDGSGAIQPARRQVESAREKVKASLGKVDEVRTRAEGLGDIRDDRSLEEAALELDRLTLLTASGLKAATRTLGAAMGTLSRAREEEAERIQGSEKALAGLALVGDEVRGTLVGAEMILSTEESGTPGGETGDVREAKEGLIRLLDERRELEAQGKELAGAEGGAQQRERGEDLRWRAERLVRLIREQAGCLGAAVEAFERAQRAARGQGGEGGRRQGASGRSAGHCMACGGDSPGGLYCPHCGVRSPVTLTCPACGAASLLPMHVLSRSGRRVVGSPHCTSCGAAHDETFQEMAKRYRDLSSR